MRYSCYGLTFFFLLFCFFGLGQNSELQQILAAKDDTAKVGRLVAYGQDQIEKDTTKALQALHKALDLSNRLQHLNGAGAAFYYLGSVSLNGGNYANAAKYFRSSVESYKKGGNLRLMAKSLTSVGIVHGYQAQTDSCIYYFIKAIEILEQNQYLPELAKAYLNLGIMYDNLEDHKKCIAYQEKALRISKQLKDTLYWGMELGSISSAHRQMGNFKEAYKYAVESLNLAKAKKTDLFLLSSAYDNYSNACVDLKMYDEGIKAGKAALQYADSIGHVQLMISASMGLAGAYKVKGEYKEGVALFKETLQKCKDVDNVMFLRDIYRFLAEGSYAMGNYKEAYDYYTNFEKYEDTLFNEENRQSIAELEIKYQTAQKEKTLSEKQLQIARNEVDLQKSRQYTLYSILAAFVALLVAGLIYANFQHRKRQHVRQLQSLQKDKEIQLLQALMQGEEKERSRIAKDLHDGIAGMLAAVKMHFNTLPAKNKELESMEGFQQANKLLDEAAVEVRKTSHNLMPEVLLQHGLDEALRRYCNNVSNAILSIQYDSWGEIGRYKSSFELSVYRIVQELLNNIIRHSKATHAIVQMSQQNGILSLTIEDNGIGFQLNLQKDGTGIQSLKSRVRAMNGKIEVASDPGSGVSAYLEFDTVGLVEEAPVQKI